VVIDNQSAVYDDLTFDNVAAIAGKLYGEIHIWNYDKIELIYNQFKMLQLKLFKQQFLPLAPIQSDLQLQLAIIF
jgi:F-type H+-transporting ATPase subunit gamma